LAILSSLLKFLIDKMAVVVHTYIIPVVGKLRQEDEFEASLGPVVRPCLKNNNKKLTKIEYIQGVQCDLIHICAVQ
jgi:hypothetical protein